MGQPHASVRKLCVAVTAALSLLSGVCNCLAGSSARFHSDTNGYSVAIPEGWKVVPERTFRQLFGPAFSDNNLSFDLEAVLALDFTEDSLAYPYVVVQVKKYAKYGVDQPLSKGEIQEVFDVLTEGVSQLGRAENMVTSLPENMQKVVSRMQSGQTYVDREHVSLLQGMDIEAPGVGKIRQAALWRCGRRAIVKIAFICAETGWDEFATERDLALDSLHFDATMDYEGAPVASAARGRKARNNGSFWEDMLVDVAVYGIIGGVMFAIGLIGNRICKMRTKSTERAGASPQEEVRDNTADHGVRSQNQPPIPDERQQGPRMD